MAPCNEGILRAECRRSVQVSYSILSQIGIQVLGYFNPTLKGQAGLRRMARAVEIRARTLQMPFSFHVTDSTCISQR